LRARERSGPSALGPIVIVSLLALSAVGFGLYLSKPGVISTSSQVVTQSITVTKDIIPRAEMNAIPFLPQYRQSVHDAWLLFAPDQNGSFVLSIHAEGLSPTLGTGGSYLVRGLMVNPSVVWVPIGRGIVNSTLQADASGVGNFYVVLSQNPELVYESIQIDRQFASNSTLIVIATASLLPSAAG